MTKTLPKTDSGTDYIQFRGYQTSVTLDDFGVRFRTGRRETPDGTPDVLAHEPLPVVDAEDITDPDTETPRNALAREVAEALTDGDFANPLVCWGVVCEWPAHAEDTEDDSEGGQSGAVCGETFDSPRALNGHLRVHYDDGVDESDVDEAGPEAMADDTDTDAAFEDTTGTPASGETTADALAEEEGESIPNSVDPDATPADHAGSADAEDKGMDEDADSAENRPSYRGSALDTDDPARSTDSPDETDDDPEDA